MKCDRCPADAGLFYSCEECRKKKAEYQKQRRDKYRAANRCLVCGVKAAQGRRHCARHLAYYRARG